MPSAVGIEAVEWLSDDPSGMTVRITGRWRRRRPDWRGPAMLVIDAVICGFGRLGNWFGIERWGVRPDMVVFAKGVSAGVLPVGGVEPETMAPWRAAGAAGFGLGSALYRPGMAAGEVGERARAFVTAFSRPAA